MAVQRPIINTQSAVSHIIISLPKIAHKPIGIIYYNFILNIHLYKVVKQALFQSYIFTIPHSYKGIPIKIDRSVNSQQPQRSGLYSYLPYPMDSCSVFRFSTYSPTYVLKTQAAKLSNMTLFKSLNEYLNRHNRRYIRCKTTSSPLNRECYGNSSRTPSFVE